MVPHALINKRRYHSLLCFLFDLFALQFKLICIHLKTVRDRHSSAAYWEASGVPGGLGNVHGSECAAVRDATPTDKGDERQAGGSGGEDSMAHVQVEAEQEMARYQRLGFSALRELQLPAAVKHFKAGLRCERQGQTYYSEFDLGRLLRHCSGIS